MYLTWFLAVILSLFSVYSYVSTEEIVDNDRQPVYKYRYETEDLMKTAESGVPIHGYHIVEGGYYPQPRFVNFQVPPNGVQFPDPRFGLALQPQFIPPPPPVAAPIAPVGVLPHIASAGGQYTDQSVYKDGKQHLNDNQYKNIASADHASGKEDQAGFQQGQAQIRNNKGDTAYYSGQQGQKNAVEDGKSYQGSQNYDQQGKNADEVKQKQNHKKGHVIKGFKTSHHKDETGRTEEYYDESNDEGGNYNFKGSAGSFADNAQNSYKGGHEKEQFNADQSKKQGHVENLQVLDNANGDKGDYAKSKSYGQGQTYAVNNGVDQQSLLGHQESSRFLKHHPYHIPFYKNY